MPETPKTALEGLSPQGPVCPLCCVPLQDWETSWGSLCASRPRMILSSQPALRGSELLLLTNRGQGWKKCPVHQSDTCKHHVCLTSVLLHSARGLCDPLEMLLWGPEPLSGCAGRCSPQAGGLQPAACRRDSGFCAWPAAMLC